MLEEVGITVEVAADAQAIGGGDPPAVKIVLGFQEEAEAADIIRASVLHKSSGITSSDTDPVSTLDSFGKKIGGNASPAPAVDAEIARVHQ